MYDFGNIKPRQIKPIDWGWTNERDKDGNLWVKQSPGKITMPDLCSHFDWANFEVSTPDKLHLDLGTTNMKSIFTTAARFLGYEKLLVDRPELGAIVWHFREWNRQLLNRIKGIKYFVIGDDIAHSGGLMMNPEVWRAWLKPYLSSLVELALRHDCRVIYHSDGDISEILDDLTSMDLTAIDGQPVGRMRDHLDKGEYHGVELFANDDPENKSTRSHWT